LVLSEVICDTTHGLGDIAFVSFDVDLWILGGLVRGRDAGEVCIILLNVEYGLLFDVHTFDLARPCFLVEALWVTLLDNRERRIDENLDEAKAGLLMQLTSNGTVGAVWRDKGCSRDATCVCKQFGDLQDI
jgi:hypothetical protein